MKVTDITDQNQHAVDQFADYIEQVVTNSRDCSRFDIPLTTVLNQSKILLKTAILQRLTNCRVDLDQPDMITVFPSVH